MGEGFGIRVVNGHVRVFSVYASVRDEWKVICTMWASQM